MPGEGERRAHREWGFWEGSARKEVQGKRMGCGWGNEVRGEGRRCREKEGGKEKG